LTGENINRNKANGGGHSVAVFLKVLEGFVSVLGQIHLHSSDNLEERFGRD
jgi:hypothetical protein